MIKREWYVAYKAFKNGEIYDGSGRVIVSSLFEKAPDLLYFSEDIKKQEGFDGVHVSFCHRQSVAPERKTL